MSIGIEVFGAGGIAVGIVAGTGRVRDLLETGSPLVLERVTWHALDDAPAAGTLTVAPDDVFLATTDEPDEMPVHAQWHDIVLDVGPYRVSGQMPTMPGFDPGRALARPTGEFVQLRDVTVGLLGGQDESGLTRTAALVNRYVVDRVEADLMLGFFFPGATLPAPVSTTTAAGGPLIGGSAVASPPP